MTLKIITPEQIIFSGEVRSVTMPGVDGYFSILKNHAPMISVLTKGCLRYRLDGPDQEIEVVSGFAEVNNNVVTVCLELN